jgi:hypothetical protein
MRSCFNSSFSNETLVTQKIQAHYAATHTTGDHHGSIQLHYTTETTCSKTMRWHKRSETEIHNSDGGPEESRKVCQLKSFGVSRCKALSICTMEISSSESGIRTYRGSREGDTRQQSDPQMKPMAVTKQYAINMSTFNRKNTYLRQKSDGRSLWLTSGRLWPLSN